MFPVLNIVLQWKQGGYQVCIPLTCSGRGA